MPGKLLYFDAGGRAEAIRAMLYHANFQFEDVRLSWPEFAQMKAAGHFPLGSIPVWEEDGTVYPQSNAILRMLAMRLGYYSQDHTTCWEIDSMMDFCEDIFDKFIAFYMPVFSGNPVDPAAAPAWYADFWDKFLPVAEARLAAHGGDFLAGTTGPSCADFKCFTFIILSVKIPQSPTPAEIKVAVDAKIAAHPNV